MRIRKHSRITALVLALVMILPLISIPTFAEETGTTPALNWSQNFDSATQNSDVLSAWSKCSEVKDGAVRLNFAGYEDGTVYVNRNKKQGDYYVATDVTYTNAEKTQVSCKVKIDNVDYTVAGTLNKSAYGSYVAATSVTPAPASGTTFYLACAAAKDLHAGFNNIANATTFKTADVDTSKYSKVTFTADLYFSEDLPQEIYMDILWNAANGTRLNIGTAKTMGNRVEVSGHGDTAGTSASRTIHVLKNQTFQLKIVFDFVKGTYTAYANNQMFRVATAQDAAVKSGIKSNGFHMQYKRSINLDVDAAKGYVSVDNLAMSSDLSARLGTIDFESFEGITTYSTQSWSTVSGLGGVVTLTASGMGKNFHITPPTTLSAVTEANGNTFLKYDFDWQEQLKKTPWYKLSKDGQGNVLNDEDGNGLPDCVAYALKIKDNKGAERHIVWTKQNQIRSYKNGVITLVDGTTYTVSNSTFTDGDITYTVSDPVSLAKGSLVGVDGARDKNVAVGLPYVTSDECKKLELSAKYYIEYGSKGTSQSQFYQVNINGKNTYWLSLYSISLADGALTGLKTSTGVRCPIGSWFEMKMIIDMETGSTVLYVNDVKAGTIELGGKVNFSSATSYYGGASWSLAKMFKDSTNETGKGYIAFDDVTTADATNYDKVFYANTSFNAPGLLGKPAVAAAMGMNSLHTLLNTTISDEVGALAWKISYDRNDKTVSGHTSHGLNVDKNPLVQQLPVSHNDTEFVTFETSYFIDSNANGQIQSQLNPVKVGKPVPDLDGSKYKYEEDGVTIKRKSSLSYTDLYVINFTGNGSAKLTREAGTAWSNDVEAYFSTGVWNTVACVLNLKTGYIDYYLNGEFVFNDQINASAGVDVSKNKNNEPYVDLSIDANKWIVGKVNKAGSTGTFYVNNVKMYKGNPYKAEPAETPDSVSVNFEEYVYSVGKSAIRGGFSHMASLATYVKEANGNLALRMDMGAEYSADAWSLVRMRENGSVDAGISWNIDYKPGNTKVTYNKAEYEVKYDEAFGLSYVEIGGRICYIVPSNVAEAAAGKDGANVASSAIIGHKAYSCKDQKYVVFSEDLFIEEGSNGIIESQFSEFKYYDDEDNLQSDSGWLQLFHLDMEDGLIDGENEGNMGIKLDIGNWNTIKVVADLEDGVFYIYANGVLARIYDCGKDNLILGDYSDWIFAKVQRHTNLKGVPYHGGLLIDNVSIGVEEYSYSESYGAQFLTDETFENYTADLLTVVDAASIRFKAPCGLRFGSIVNTEKVEVLKKLYGAEKTKMGTIITPADYVTDEYEENDSLQGITREDLEDVRYLDLAFDGAYFQGDAHVNLEEGADYMVGSIVGIRLSNYERKFAGMGYIEFETENGVIGIYTDMTLRSVYDVANECYVSGAELTDEQNKILECYLMGDELPPEYMPEVEE